MNVGAKRSELVQLLQKFVPRSHIGIFRTKRARSTHWILNSCFCAFLSILVHLGPFCYCTKLAAKRAKLVQLMQKFVNRCLVRIFRIKRSRSTPLDLKLIFCCVSFRLGTFGTVSLLHKTCCKTRQINAKVRATNSHRIFLQRIHPIHPIGP